MSSRFWNSNRRWNGQKEIEQGNEKISFVLSAYFPEGISGDFRDVIQQMQMDAIAYETHRAKSKAVSEEDEVRYQTLQKRFMSLWMVM